jgi:hypothetical protein
MTWSPCFRAAAGACRGCDGHPNWQDRQHQEVNGFAEHGYPPMKRYHLQLISTQHASGLATVIDDRSPDTDHLLMITDHRFYQA